MKASLERGIAYSFFEYMMATTLILSTRSMWMHLPSIGFMTYAAMALLVISAFGAIISKRRHSRKKTFSTIIAIGALALYLCMGFLWPNTNISYYGRSIIRLLCVVLFVGLVKDDRDQFSLLYKYENVMLFIAAYSLLFWVFGSLLHMIRSTGIALTSWTGSDTLKIVRSYHNLYYETQTTDILSYVGIIRNTSIFTEAPMYGFHLCIAFMVEFFARPKQSKWKLALLVVSILSSFSMMAYICLALAVFFRIIFMDKRRKTTQILRLCIVPMVLVAVFLFLDYILESKLGTTSGNTRIDDFIAGYKTWRENPLIGRGFGNTKAIIQHMSSFRIYNKGFSNSLMYVLAMGGLHLMLPVFVCCVLGVVNTYADKMAFSFFVLFVMMYVFTLLPYENLTFYLFAFFATYHPRPENVNGEHNALEREARRSPKRWALKRITY